jgi:hypothetical protein
MQQEYLIPKESPKAGNKIKQKRDDLIVPFLFLHELLFSNNQSDSI